MAIGDTATANGVNGSNDAAQHNVDQNREPKRNRSAQRDANGYRARRPSAFAPWRSAEPAGSLGRQGASSWKTRFATVGFHRLAHQEQKGHERRTPCRPGGERDHHAPSRVRSKKSLIGISARAISSAIAASGNRPCSSTNSRQYSSKVFGRTISSMSSAAGLSERVIAEIMGWEEEHVARIIRRYVDRSAATKAIIRQLNETRT
jgi:hypothetical protein